MAIRIKKAIVPKGRKWGRTGRKLVGKRSVTIHNTANPGATAANHATYLKAGHAISWHYTVDDKEAYQHVPNDEQAWHTGTNAGNTTSIGIEVCEFSDKARAREAEDNAVWLAAKVLHNKGLSVNALRTHKSWSGKACPRDILPHWDEFCRRVKVTLLAMNSAYPGKVITLKASGTNVRWIQRRLKAHGISVTIDGEYGPKTYAAVKKFRERTFRMRPQTGSVGPKTWAALAD